MKILVSEDFDPTTAIDVDRTNMNTATAPFTSPPHQQFPAMTQPLSPLNGQILTHTKKPKGVATGTCDEIGVGNWNFRTGDVGNRVQSVVIIEARPGQDSSKNPYVQNCSSEGSASVGVSAEKKTKQRHKRFWHVRGAGGGSGSKTDRCISF